MEIEKLSSVKAISGVALPAIILNAAPPVTVAVQTALLGNHAATSALAAFAAVSTCVGFVGRVFNFLVDGVSAKVGRSAGQRDWPSLATHVSLSLKWSAALGAAAVPLLLAARRPLCAGLLGLAPEVQAAAGPYWVLRSFAAPLQLINMAAAGILQGFSRVRVNAALTSSAALLEMLGSAVVLLRRSAGHVGEGSGGAASLLALGWVTLACQALQAVASMLCIMLLPPPEAHGQVCLLQGLFGLRNRGDHSSGSGWRGSAAQERHEPLEPLLGGSQTTGRAAASPVGPDPALHSTHAAADDGTDADLVGDASRRQARQGPRLLGALFDEATLDFLRDGLNMFIRSMTLQLTFFLALAAAAQLGTAALAAHSIVGQLWVIISYAVDGFAAAGIVLGSRLYALARRPELRGDATRHMRRLINRVLLAGAASGLAAGLAFWFARGPTVALFSSDPAVTAVLQRGAWAVLAAAQPLNGLLFVFDGLMYATQAFRFVRNNMVSGFCLLFCPLLAAEAWLLPGLAAIWLAKAALNVWRLGGAAYLVFWRFMPSFGEDGGAQACFGNAEPDEPGCVAAEPAGRVALEAP